MTRREARQTATGDAPVRLIIAARIRDAQEAQGIGTEELSRLTGISLRLVQKHRAGDNAPGDISLRRYAATLGKPLSYFFTGPPLEKAAA